MKLCIPTEDDRGMEGRASRHFGSAPFFTVVEPESGRVEVLKNPDCHAHPDSCHHVPQLRGHGVEAVVCEGLGRRAAAALSLAGIEPKAVSGLTVAEVLEKVRSGEARTVIGDGPDAPGGWGRRRRRGHGHGHGRGWGWGHGEARHGAWRG